MFCQAAHIHCEDQSNTWEPNVKFHLSAKSNAIFGTYLKYINCHYSTTNDLIIYFTTLPVTVDTQAISEWCND